MAEQRAGEAVRRRELRLGPLLLNLITLGSAEFIADDASSKTAIAPLAAFYQGVVLPNWGGFGPFLTVVELAIGLGLIFGFATRWPRWAGCCCSPRSGVMLWDTGDYLWTYPAEDLFPLALLAVVPAGRVAGFDRVLAPRLGHRWPF